MKKVICCVMISAVCLLSGCAEIEAPIDTEISSGVQAVSSVTERSTVSSAVSSAVSEVDSFSAAESSSSSESLSSLPAEVPEKSDRIVLVGDSRTMNLGTYLYGMEIIDGVHVEGETPDGDYIIGAGGEGYDWLAAHTSEIEDKLTDGCALVVNMGVNGVPNFHLEIAEWCNNMAEKYKDRGVKVYFMSVNPVNDRLMKEYNYTIRNVDVICFNSEIRTELKNVTYLDTYSVIRDDILGEGVGTFDGLHYYEKPYRKIRDYTWETIKNG